MTYYISLTAPKTTQDPNWLVDLIFRIGFWTSSPFYLTSWKKLLVFSYLYGNPHFMFCTFIYVYLYGINNNTTIWVIDHTIVIKYQIILDFIYK